jgi:hypothetical protein
VSPRYEAVIVTDEVLEEGVYEMVQLPSDKVQEVESKVPPALLSLNDTVPLGTVPELEVSATDIASEIVAPEFTVLEFGEIDVLVVLSRLTVRGEVPVLVACIVSPEYVAVMVTVDCVFVLVYDTVQLPDESVHDVGLKVPPPVSLNTTVPDGVLGVLEVSVTVTVNVTDSPEVTEAEFGVMNKLVGSAEFIVKGNVAELDP